MKRTVARMAPTLAMGAMLAIPASAGAQIEDCSPYVGSKTKAGAASVGPTKCVSSETGIRSAGGAAFRRLEILVDGTIEGYTPKDGTRREMFTDAPEFALAQRGNLGPYYHGIGHYYGSNGAGMTVFVPESAADWNGKLFVLAHGSSDYSRIGEIPSRKAGEYTLRTGVNSYAALMIDQGYAVAFTRRPACCSVRPDANEKEELDEEVHLDDGTVLRDKTFGYHVGLLRDWTEIARNLVQARLGRKPARTYWYGKSGGASLARIINYKPGANRDSAGSRLFDGFLINDAGGGWYWPEMRFRRIDVAPGVFEMKPQSEDALRVDDAYRKNFVPQIDIAHQNYTGADHVQGSYLFVKRENARLLIEKGLEEKSRTYEIVGLSHSDSGGKDNLDIGGVFEALIAALDRWVEQGVAPSPTRSDAPFLGGLGAVQLPEIACPTGIYIEYAKQAPQPGSTTFIPYLRVTRPSINADVLPVPPGYQADWLEPLDRRGYLVDMNKSGVRDTRESVEQAWQRRWREGEKYGALAPRQDLTHEKYVSCVEQVTSDLVRENLLSETAAAYYVRMARQSDIGRSPSAPEITSR